MRPAARAIVPVLAAVTVLAVGFGFVGLQHDRNQDAERREAIRRAGAEGVALQRQLDRTLNSAIALAAFVQLNEGRQAPDGNIAGFEEFADRMRALVPSITNMQLAPDGVVQHIHPLEGHEAAIGHQLLVDRERSTEAFAAIDSGRLTLAGPFELVQGGTALVGRQPIYLPGAGNVPDADPDFWGFATVLIDLDDFFAASRVDELMDEGYEYEIARFDRDADGFVPFRSSGSLVDPVEVDVSVANGTWRLSLARPGGWDSGGQAWQVIGLAGLAFASAVGVRRFQVRDERLRVAVDARTAELRTAADALAASRDEAERASAAKTTFLANVSHELRTPLNAILGFSELIDPDAPHPSDRDSLGQIRTAGQHLLALINQLLDVTVVESGNVKLTRTDVDLGAVAAESVAVLEVLAAEADVTLDVDSMRAVVVGDRDRLVQVVTNLVNNAIRFTPAGGNIIVSTRADGDRCLLEVRDDGIGIPADQLDRIFQPFERGAAPATVEGTGIGLALVQRLATAMGGDVTVDSEVGEGSAFTISLPATPFIAVEPTGLASAGV